MLKPILLLASIMVAMLTLACSSGDSTEESDPPTTVRPSGGTDRVEEMRTIALNYLEAYKAADFDAMSELMDASEPFCGFLPSFCILFDGTLADWKVSDQPCATNYTNALVYGPECSRWFYCEDESPQGSYAGTAPCFEMEIRNVREAQPPGCREASPAEATKGYGSRCAFPLGFAQRQKGAEQDFVDTYQCVVVQEGANAIVARNPMAADECRF